MSTFGQSGAPNQDTINLDALLSLSLHNYNPTLVNNVSTSNAFYHEIKPRMKGKSGGISIKQNLMYALTSPDTYSGYDEILLTPTDGITQSTWEWRQAANTVLISGEEEIKNENGLEDLLQAKIQQAEEGFVEFFNEKILQGNASNSATAISTPYTNSRNGSQFIDPLAKLIAYDPTASSVVGGLDQSVQTWWRNRTLTMTATTEKDFMKQMDNMYNTASIGPGGSPDLIFVDQLSYELWRSAYYTYYRRTAEGDNNYPFPNFKFNNAKVTWGEKVCDVHSGVANTNTYGTAYFFNTKYFTPYYVNSRNFVSTPFVKPANQDVKTSQILWMGSIGLSQRRKQGVVGKIPRTLTA